MIMITTMRSSHQLFIILYCIAASAYASSSFSKPHPNSKLRLRQVLVVHRHGDRTPITPMKDEEFWQTTLPEPHVLDGIAKNTQLIRPEEGGPKAHGAVGRGPFGQLTTLGLLQMISLGERLKEELEHIHHDEEGTINENQFVNKGRLFTPSQPLHPSRIKVMSTDFPRTIQSVQALLTGMFPDCPEEEDSVSPIEIDLQHTNTYFIPDPQPRQYSEQLGLESYLAKRPHLREREEKMKELAHRVSSELEEHLGDGADSVSFGIGEEKDESSKSAKQPLAWAQLAELLVCLHSRNMLPATLSAEDVKDVCDHVAWKWFENLRHPVLAKTAMWRFASSLVDNMQQKVNEDIDCNDEEPWLCLFSAHDSTLVGLLCVLQLEMPSVWPEYASAVKVELIQEEDEDKIVQHWVRFSLNGQVLRSTWMEADGKHASMVPLDKLTDMIHDEHDLYEDDENSIKYSWKAGLLTQH